MRADPAAHAAFKAKYAAAEIERRKNPAYVEKWRAYHAAHSKRHNGNPRGWAERLLQRAKLRSEKAGIPFGITVDDLDFPTTCMFTGAVLRYGSFHHDPAGASLDRKLAERGYVRGNVRIISYLANRLRQDCCDPVLFRAFADDAEKIMLDAGRVGDHS